MAKKSGEISETRGGDPAAKRDNAAAKTETQPPRREKQNSDMRELAAAMRCLADAVNQTNALLADARREDPNWRKVPELLADLARQLRMISSRL